MFWYKYLGADKIKEGEIISILSREYVLKGGILRQKKIYSDSQSQTKEAFGFKWNKRDTYESPIVQDSARNWLIERYLGGRYLQLSEWLHSSSKVLDAGCGSGFSSVLFFDGYFDKINYLGVDISGAVDVAIQRFREKNLRAEFLQADILSLPFSNPVFDMIFSEGVLHHTDSTERAIKYLSSLLMKNGRFLFYVYKKKGPIREYTDDLIRNYISKMDDSKAWEAIIPLSKFGKMLGDMNIEINIPDEIPYLEIPAGPINLQRLFYWHIFKAFFKPEWTLDEMNHINFDWYRPFNCHRHTPEEIEMWCGEAGLAIEHIDIQESGITVVAIKH